jgi:hypothetical protein
VNNAKKSPAKNIEAKILQDILAGTYLGKAKYHIPRNRPTTPLTKPLTLLLLKAATGYL